MFIPLSHLMGRVLCDTVNWQQLFDLSEVTCGDNLLDQVP